MDIKLYLTYYASIMLDAFTHLLCSKLCWHNRPGPIYKIKLMHNKSEYIINLCVNCINMFYISKNNSTFYIKNSLFTIKSFVSLLDIHSSLFSFILSLFLADCKMSAQFSIAIQLAALN